MQPARDHRKARHVPSMQVNPRKLAKSKLRAPLCSAFSSCRGGGCQSRLRGGVLLSPASLDGTGWLLQGPLASARRVESPPGVQAPPDGLPMLAIKSSRTLSSWKLCFRIISALTAFSVKPMVSSIISISLRFSGEMPSARAVVSAPTCGSPWCCTACDCCSSSLRICAARRGLPRRCGEGDRPWPWDGEG